MKKCPTCLRFKARDDFSRNASRGDGLQYECKPCSASRQRAAGRSRVPGSQNAERRRMWRYGISACQYTRLRIEQGDRCAICREEVVEHIDHCHTSGAVRGLLCGKCNRGLGQFGDDVTRLSAAVAYLTR